MLNQKKLKDKDIVMIGTFFLGVFPGSQKDLLNYVTQQTEELYGASF